MSSSAPFQSDPQTLVSLALRLKGFGEVDVIASVHGLDEAIAAEHLTSLVDAEKATAREVDGSVKYVLTKQGRSEGEAALGVELDASGQRDAVRSAYEAFLLLNGKMLQLCTDWQIVEGTESINDHSDDDYDQEIIGRLVDLDGGLRKVMAPLRGALARFDAYPARFREALDRLLGGEIEYFTKPIISSYHTVWFELHEDLLATLGIDRASEAGH
ncbi:MAG: hypothetical protein ACI8Y4_002331 [Candidatus Poriferisodalaceae bacterium]|jgi:hypothetical protein